MTRSSVATCTIMKAVVFLFLSYIWLNVVICEGATVFFPLSYLKMSPDLALQCLSCARNRLESDLKAQYVHMPRELSSCLTGCPVTAVVKIDLDVQGGKVSNRDGSWDLGVKSHQCPRLCFYGRMLWQDPCFLHFSGWASASSLCHSVRNISGSVAC